MACVGCAKLCGNGIVGLGGSRCVLSYHSE